MAAMGLRTTDVARLTGKNRATVWRWRKAGKCPAYVATILNQQGRIKNLVRAVAN